MRTENLVPHPYAEVLGWIAEGRKIQRFDAGLCQWLGVDSYVTLGDIAAGCRFEYRIKPSPKPTITINVTIPEPMREAPEMWDALYLVTLGAGEKAARFTWTNEPWLKRYFDAGLIFATQADAEAAANAILGALKGGCDD